jgi:SSS family solute:Na+ symporter
LALVILLLGMPGGPAEVLAVANENGKFSLGDSSFLFSKSTIWVVLAFGLFDNLRNFGIDQSYVQRYIASRSDREAAKSVWVGALLYVPVSALFLFIGSSLYAYYEGHPQDLDEVRRIVAEQKLMQAGVSENAADYPVQLAEMSASLTEGDLGDRVFPHFIAAHLPQGVRGLLIAAVFAAAMSTVSTSLNSSATLVMSDFYRRLIRRDSTDAQNIGVLRLSTIAWGAMGTAMALALVRLTDSTLDVWWTLSGVLGAGIVGLFLLGITVPRLHGASAITAFAIGGLVIAWMTISQTSVWPDSWAAYANPMDKFMTIVVGPCLMIGLGVVFAAIGFGDDQASRKDWSES